MFGNGFIKVAKKAEVGMLETAGNTLKKWWGSAKPHVDAGLHHLKSSPALHAAGAGALGGAAVGATSKDEFGRMRGLDGAISGALKGGATGAIGGAAYNRYKSGPANLATAGKAAKPAAQAARPAAQAAVPTATASKIESKVAKHQAKVQKQEAAKSKKAAKALGANPEQFKHV